MTKARRLIFMVVLFSACTYPRIVQKTWSDFNQQFSLSTIDTLHVGAYHVSAIERHQIGLTTLYESLDLSVEMEQMLANSLGAYPRIHSAELRQLEELQSLYRTKVRRRKLAEFLKGKEFRHGTLIPIVKYDSRYRARVHQSGPGGGAWRTGENVHWIYREVHLAGFSGNDLFYLGSTVMTDSVIVPSGTPITHEFPQEVLDSLMQMALEPLLKELNRNK